MTLQILKMQKSKKKTSNCLLKWSNVKEPHSLVPASASLIKYLRSKQQQLLLRKTLDIYDPKPKFSQ